MSEIVKIAAQVKALRIERGYSLRTLADRAGVAKSTLHRLENAAGNTTLESLGRVLVALDAEIVLRPTPKP